MLPWGSTVELRHVGLRTAPVPGRPSALRGAARAGARVAVRRRADAVDDALGGRLSGRRRARRPGQPRALRGRRSSSSTSASATRARWPVTRRRRCWRRCARRAGSRRCCRPRTRPGWGRSSRAASALPRWLFTLTATDANRTALRIARLLTGRPARAGLLLLLPRLRRRGVRGRAPGGRTVSRAGNVGPPVDVAHDHDARSSSTTSTRSRRRCAAARSRACWPSRR